MKFIMFHPVHFEEWDYRNLESGIGGSETNQIEMAWRLAKRGHEVISYAPVPVDCDRHWRGVEWRHLDEVDFAEDGIWIVYRAPNTADNFEPNDNQRLWLMCQDEDYPTFNEERVSKFERVMPLCRTHANNLTATKPYLKDKIWITTNGIRVDLIRDIEPPERNPNRIMYASSPDRGLKYVLETFKKAREFMPELEFHAFYGFDNIDKLIKMAPRFSHYEKLKAEIEELMQQDNVYWHGRIAQRDLYQEWMKTGIWLYQTNFSETSCITCMEAQALGAIPITNPTWALGENVRHGIFIEGDAWNDRLIKGRYLGELLRLASNPTLQDSIRGPMMAEAKFQRNWERVVDQWEASIYTPEQPQLICQLIFQRKHTESFSNILNVGSSGDPAAFRSVDAVNLDVVDTHPQYGYSTEADVIADIRALPESLKGSFDAVVLGDVLEHMNYNDGVVALASCRQALRNGGRVVVTCPEDYREVENTGFYTEGCTLDHRLITKPELYEMVSAARLSIVFEDEIDYDFALGTGLVCREEL